MEATLIPIAIVVFVAAFVIQRFLRVRRARDVEQSIASATNAASTTNDGERNEGQRRAESLATRPEKPYVPLKVIGDEQTSADAETYRAAYELIARGIDVQLDMADVTREFGAVGSYVDVVAPHVSSRMTYTTAGFAPYLGTIKSIADFQRYAPYRAHHEMWLSVHADDLTEAYALLRELKIRLSALHHPDQMWWKP